MLRRAIATLALFVGCSSGPGPSVTPTGGSGGDATGGSGASVAGSSGGDATGGSGGTATAGSGGSGGGATAGSGGGGSGGSTGGATAGSGGGGSGGGGSGGAVGGTGGDGCGGAGGTTPECAACMGGTLVDPVEACLLDADGAAVLMSLTAQVTVVSFDQVAGPKCDTFTGSAAMESRLIVEDATTAKRWTIYLRLPDLPADLVKAGDALDLQLTASRGGFPQGPSQLIVLTRAGALVAFGLDGYYLPGKVTDDVTLASGGTCSVTHPAQCYFSSGLGQVTVGSSSALIGARQTKVVGDVAVTLDTVSYFNPGGGGCDGSSDVRAGGFRMPPAGP